MWKATMLYMFISLVCAFASWSCYKCYCSVSSQLVSGCSESFQGLECLVNKNLATNRTCLQIISQVCSEREKDYHIFLLRLWPSYDPTAPMFT